MLTFSGACVFCIFSSSLCPNVGFKVLRKNWELLLTEGLTLDHLHSFTVSETARSLWLCSSVLWEWFCLFWSLSEENSCCCKFTLFYDAILAQCCPYFPTSTLPAARLWTKVHVRKVHCRLYKWNEVISVDKLHQTRPWPEQTNIFPRKPASCLFCSNMQITSKNFISVKSEPMRGV